MRLMHSVKAALCFRCPMKTRRGESSGEALRASEMVGLMRVEVRSTDTIIMIIIIIIIVMKLAHFIEP